MVRVGKVGSSAALGPNLKNLIQLINIRARCVGAKLSSKVALQEHVWLCHRTILLSSCFSHSYWEAVQCQACDEWTFQGRTVMPSYFLRTNLHGRRGRICAALYIWFISHDMDSNVTTGSLYLDDLMT